MEPYNGMVNFYKPHMFHAGHPMGSDQALAVKRSGHTLTFKNPQGSQCGHPMELSGFLRTDVFHAGHSMGTDSAHTAKGNGFILILKNQQGSQWGFPAE